MTVDELMNRLAHLSGEMEVRVYFDVDDVGYEYTPTHLMVESGVALLVQINDERIKE